MRRPPRERMTRWLVLVALAAAACGVRTRPLPPELVQPEPPTALVASSTVDGVRLSWHRPTQYSGGKHMRDLGGFDVERALGDSYYFAPVGTVLLDDQTRFRQEKLMQWTDTAVEVGETYRYRVIAFTTDDYRSVPSAPVTTVYKKVAAPPPDESK
jgi:hypothetical protein